MTVRPLRTFLLATALSAALISCSATNMEDTPESSSGQPAVVDQQSDSPVEPEAQVDPEFVLKRYQEIAKQSCELALKKGVVEQSSDGLVKLIMVPKDQAYLGFSAVYVEQYGSQESDLYVEFLYEVGYFSACSDYVDMETAKDAGEEFDYVQIIEDLPSSTYLVTREFDGEEYTMKYWVANGVIASAERIIENSIELQISYGTGEAEAQLLIGFVEEQLAEN